MQKAHVAPLPMQQKPAQPLWPKGMVLAGPATAILVAWLCSLPQDNTNNGLTIANVALIMVVVTVGFAVLDSIAGVTTSIVGALALNFFHTVPYRTLRITDRRDVYSVVLLGSLGLAVSSISALRVRRGIRSVRQATAENQGRQLAEILASKQPAPQIWVAAISASSSDLALVTAQLVANQPHGMAVVRRRFHDGDDPMFGLPSDGAALHLVVPGAGKHEAATASGNPPSEGRWLIVSPRSGLGGFEIDRRAILAFADTIELGLESPSLAHAST